MRLRRPQPVPEVRLVERDDVYRVYFHGPAYRVLDRAWHAGDAVVGVMPETLPPNHTPTDRPLLAAPRLVELCFQTAGLREIGETGRMGLPHRVDRIRFLRDAWTARGRLHAVVRPGATPGTFDARVVDEAGDVFVSVEGYATVALGEVDAGLLWGVETGT